MREIDEPIPADEQLFREIAVGDVNGDEVFVEVVDIAGTSVTREKYRSAEEIVPSRPERNGLAVITPGTLPTNIDDLFEFFAKDRPEDDNDAHAEIWPGRLPSAEVPNGDRGRTKPWYPKQRTVRVKLRIELAKRFRIYRAPTTISDAQPKPPPVESEGDTKREPVPAGSESDATG